MEDPIKQRFSDTKPEAAGPVTPSDHATLPGQPAAQDVDTDLNTPGDFWPEAADAKCSESAALFASTQPAPLSVV